MRPYIQAILSTLRHLLSYGRVNSMNAYVCRDESETSRDISNQAGFHNGTRKLCLPAERTRTSKPNRTSQKYRGGVEATVLYSAPIWVLNPDVQGTSHVMNESRDRKTVHEP